MDLKLLIIIVIAILLLWLFTSHQENLLAPWELTNCLERCNQQSQQVPWNGGPKGAWDDPANFSSSNFDTAGCVANCHQATFMNQEPLEY